MKSTSSVKDSSARSFDSSASASSVSSDSSSSSDSFDNPVSSNGSYNEDWNPWGNPDDPALKVEMPNIHVSMSSGGMAELTKYHSKNAVLSKIVSVGGIILVVGFIGGMISTCVTDNGIGAGIGALIFVVCLAIILICLGITSKNNKAATALFKNEFVRKELGRYVDRLQLLDGEYTYQTIPDSRVTNEDLTGALPAEQVLHALGLSNAKCNENHVNEWMSGFYHGTRFRFYEAKLLNVYYTGSGKNQQKHEELVYCGQGYIFKSTVAVPFPIQYNFNAEVEDITIENFHNVFRAFKCEQVYGTYNLTAKELLDESEQKVFSILEAREFKVCLLKLAKIYQAYCKQCALIFKTLSQDMGETMKNFGKLDSLMCKVGIRLQNENIIILHEGPFNYFEINLDNELRSEFDKFSGELSEFVSVLETMGALSLISGEKQTR